MTLADNLEQARSALTMIQPEPFNAEAPPDALAGDVTPTGLHYVRSNFALPAHDGTLDVGGAVENPKTLTLDDLRAMPSVERVVTMECAGNGRRGQTPLPVGEPWGDFAVSTARWTGAFLHEVLEQARPAANALDVEFEGADPAPGATIPAGTYTVRGKAWSGTGPVTRVHISLTGEGDWHPAELEPPKGPYQWQDWSFDWQATAAGRHTLRARATDAAGNVQPDVPPWNRLGYGNNAIGVFYVDVR